VTGVPVDVMGTVVTVVTGVEGISKVSFAPVSGTGCVQPQVTKVTTKNRIRNRRGDFIGSSG
jgi:hypothetical protein